MIYTDLLNAYPINLARDVYRNSEQALHVSLPGVETALELLGPKKAEILHHVYYFKTPMAQIGQMCGIREGQMLHTVEFILECLRKTDFTLLFGAGSYDTANDPIPLIEVAEQKVAVEPVDTFEVVVEPSTSNKDIKPAPAFNVLDTPIEELGLTTRSYNGLKRSGADTVRDVIRMIKEPHKIRNFGAASLRETKTKLILMGVI